MMMRYIIERRKNEANKVDVLLLLLLLIPFPDARFLITKSSKPNHSLNVSFHLPSPPPTFELPQEVKRFLSSLPYLVPSKVHS